MGVDACLNCAFSAVAIFAVLPFAVSLKPPALPHEKLAAHEGHHEPHPSSSTKPPEAQVAHLPTSESHITRIQLDSISENVFLPVNYSFEVQVQDLKNMHEWKVKEFKAGEMKSVVIDGEPMPFTKCIYNETSMSGHIIHGVKCKNQTPSKGSFVARCHCWTSRTPEAHSVCRPYVDLQSLVTFLGSPNTTWETIAFRTHQVLSGRYDSADASVEALFLPKGSSHRWVLAEASIKTAGHVFNVPDGDGLKLQYSVLSYSEELGAAVVGTEDGSAFSPPPGVFCPPLEHATYRPPPLAEQFSFDIETILEDIQTVSYETLHFDSVEKLVSYRYRPHLHSSTRGGFLFSSLFGSFQKGSSAYRLVHDFDSGIQYTINEVNQNCTVEAIPALAIDAVPLSNHHVQIKHANELLTLGSRFLSYWGMRVIRGVVCEVWVGERGEQDGYYTTVEVLFAHPKWTVEVEVLNLEKRVPLGVITHATQNTTAGKFEKVAKSFFFDYSVGHSQWHHFDVTSCLSRTSRLFLALTLKVSYSDLARYNLELVLDSIRREIARLAGVSPLRVTDVFVTSGGERREVEAYFVLLERPNMTNPPEDKHQESLDSAFNILTEITSSGRDVAMQISVLPDEKTEIRVKSGSLRPVPDTVHSKFVHAGYTAGSMAGLGFSMALLGVCLGILAGFLTWKRQPRIPYLIAD